MFVEAIMDDAFKNFGDEVEVRNGTVTGEVLDG